MEDGDDDFGDLYADVEVEASSAMNVAPQSSQLQHVSDETINRNSHLETSSDKEDRVSDGDEDDDDDDLNIVLNSDDDSIRHGEGLTIARSNTILRNGELEDEDDDNFGTEEFGGGKAVGNSHSLYKYSRSQSAAYRSELKGRVCGPQHGQRFSLPWCRSILDVNIDVFEQKPWKHPGADITDYFNFGLNEDSWKLYRNQVDEYRHGVPVSTGNPASEPAQSMERKGRAIEVEDSIVERQSSMDVKCQMDRDSDVIQITIVDQEENHCGSVNENLEICVQKASKSNHGDVSGDDDDDDDDDGTDHLSFSSASEDESFEGNQMETEKDSPKRVSNQRSNSKLTQGSEDQEIHHSSDNTKERTGEDTCTTESSEAKKIPKNHCKSFEDRWKSSSHERCSFTELTRSVKPDNHHSDNHRHHSDKSKQGDIRYHSRYHSPVYNNRIHKDSKPKPKSHHENDDIINSRRRYEHGDYRYHARRHGNHVHNHNRTYERMHPFDPYNEENILYTKESEPPLDYYHGERFSGYEDYARFGPKMGRPVFRSSEEEEYYGEQRRYNDELGWNNKRKGNNWHFGNKDENDEFFLDSEYCDDITRENIRYFDREKDEYEHEYVTKWEFRRNKAELNNHFTEESHMNNEMIPRSSLYGRERRYEGQLDERFAYELYDDYFEPFDREEDYTIDYDDRVDVARSGDHHWQYEMQWKDDGIMTPFEKVSSGHRRFVTEHDICDHFEEYVDDPYVKRGEYNFERRSNFEYEWVFKGGVDSLDPHLVDGCDHVDDVNGCGYIKKQKREVISGDNKCRKSYGESGKKLSPSWKNSRENKFSKKHNKASQGVERKAIDERVDIEEGQIVTESVNVGPTKADTMVPFNNGNMSHKQKGNTGLDKSRILEARAKMEKRRARFNEANGATKMDSDSTTINFTVVDSVQETGPNKPQRPARKRRWGGS